MPQQFRGVDSGDGRARYHACAGPLRRMCSVVARAPAAALTPSCRGVPRAACTAGKAWLPPPRVPAVATCACTRLAATFVTRPAPCGRLCVGLQLATCRSVQCYRAAYQQTSGHHFAHGEAVLGGSTAIHGLIWHLLRWDAVSEGALLDTRSIQLFVARPVTVAVLGCLPVSFYYW